MSNLKAFYVGDMDIYAAESAEHALRLANDLAGDPAMFELGDVAELSDAQLDLEYPEMDEHEQPTGGVVTARQWLAAMTEPGWMAGNWD